MADYLVARLKRKLRAGERIVSLSHDLHRAGEADVDFALVGDSRATCSGADTMVGVTLAQMIYHTRSSATSSRARDLDMPFGTCSTPKRRSTTACAFTESGCGGVKFEGRQLRRPTRWWSRAFVSLPRLPQRVYADGGFRIQQDCEQAGLRPTHALEQAGAFAVA
jgi:ketopantoate hydroxymethyltransferase